ncbi:hypothetical protein [Pseudomonas sp. FP2300]|uniref:hypothetical protein n=1 Tax=Pseudomonas sp. FP2300 TaxID=2954090 RepID=UPI00273649AD|nr:hypothetical protein [Pseudomonas sp. FP2300]WLH61149.1 hypothetical protein PSH86_20740 [Pseudomonas sp. FP2300]
MPLSNKQRADLMRYAIRNAPLIENGLYHFRLAMFDVLEGSSINRDRFIDFFAPPGQPIGNAHWENIDAVPNLIEADEDPSLEVLNVALMLF